MKTFTIFILCMAALALAAKAQEYEQGKVADLKGLNALFVETDGDLKAKEKIEKKIRKARLAGLRLVEDMNEADMILRYRSAYAERAVAVTTRTSPTTAVTVPRVFEMPAGTGALFIEGDEKLKLVFRFQNVQNSGWEDAPESKIAAEFIKYYKQANGLK